MCWRSYGLFDMVSYKKKPKPFSIEQDAVLGDTFATIDQNRQLVDWMKKSGKNSIGRTHSVAEGLAELGKRMSGVEDFDSFWQEGTAARGAGEPPGLFRSRLRDFE